MSDTLRDQLLGLGFKPVPKPDKPVSPSPGARGAHPSQRSGRDAKAAASPSPNAEHPNPERRRPRAAHERRPASSKSAAHPSPRTSASTTQPAAAGKPDQRRSHPASRPRAREDIDLAKAYAIRAQREKDERIAAEREKQQQARQRREAKAKLVELLKDKGLNDASADIARHFDYGGKIKRIHVTAEQLKALNAGELGVVQLDGRYVLITAALLAEAESIFAAAIALKIDPSAPAADDPYADPQYRVPDDLVW
ncbi:MAG: DUF2058 family protein [Luteimonas sp.]